MGADGVDDDGPGVLNIAVINCLLLVPDCHGGDPNLVFIDSTIHIWSADGVAGFNGGGVVFADDQVRIKTTAGGESETGDEQNDCEPPKGGLCHDFSPILPVGGEKDSGVLGHDQQRGCKRAGCDRALITLPERRLYMLWGEISNLDWIS